MITRHLAEKRAKGDEVARSIEAHDDLEANTKAANRLAKDQLSVLRENTSARAREIREGTEIRIVECSERPDYAANVVHLHRDDTGELVETRPMDMEERQAPLVGIGDGGRKKGKRAADEQTGA